MNRENRVTGTDRRPTRAAHWSVAALLRLGGLLGGLLGAFYVLRIEPHWIEVTTPTAHVADLPEPLDGLTIVQLSDLHASAATRDAVHHLVERANALHPGLVVLTGDYVQDAARDLPPIAAELGGLSARYGAYAILGNHDARQGAGRVAAGLEREGLTVLRDRAVRVPVGETGLWLIGLEDLGISGWSSRTLHIAELAEIWQPQVERLDGLLRNLPPAEPRILLVHNPDLNECLADQDLDLALSGHTHGGQVRLPLIGAPLVPSVMGQKYVAGWAEGPASPVYVNRGLGANILNVRLNARPEITLLTLRRGDGAASVSDLQPGPQPVRDALEGSDVVGVELGQAVRVDVQNSDDARVLAHRDDDLTP